MIDSPAALYDALHKRFGVGSWDESLTSTPWWKARNTEISKIKAMMKKRRRTLEDLVLAFDFAVEHRRPVTESWHLFELVEDAKKHRRTAEQQTATDVREALTAAAVEAHEAGETVWAARLYNASESAGATVLQQWLDERSTT